MQFDIRENKLHQYRDSDCIVHGKIQINRDQLNSLFGSKGTGEFDAPLIINLTPRAQPRTPPRSPKRNRSTSKERATKSKVNPKMQRIEIVIANFLLAGSLILVVVAVTFVCFNFYNFTNVLHNLFIVGDDPGRHSLASALVLLFLYLALTVPLVNMYIVSIIYLHAVHKNIQYQKSIFDDYAFVMIAPLILIMMGWAFSDAKYYVNLSTFPVGDNSTFPSDMTYSEVQKSIIRFYRNGQNSYN